MKQKLENFLDSINQYELIPIRFLQNLFKAEKLVNFHRSFEFLASPQTFSFIPLLFYSINKYDSSFQFAKCSIFYIFITHKFKRMIFRKRPYAYPGIFNHDNVKSSSFPSNHTAGSVILASFFPTNYIYLKIFFVFLMQLNRVILGCHFPSDTIIGALIGLLIIFISSLFENSLILILILLLIFYDDPYFSWLFGSSLSFFIRKSKKDVKLNSLCAPFCFVVFPFLNGIKKIFQKQIEKEKSIFLFAIHFCCYYMMRWILFFISYFFYWMNF